MIYHFPDIPRLYTALAEFLACSLVCLPYLRQMSRSRAGILLFLSFSGQALLQLLAGLLPLVLWIPGMVINVAWMFLSIRLLSSSSSFKFQLYQTAKAFIMAELVASISWHLYCLILYRSPYDTLFTQVLTLLLLYGVVFSLLYWQLKKINSQDLERIIERRDVYTAFFTSLTIFALSNTGFILSNTDQFRDSMSIFLVRTTINISGILLLLTQETLQYERYLKEELTSINSMVQLQYKQYQAYQENSDLIRRKVHDLKHQLQVLREEADKDRQNQFFDEMAQAIVNFEAKVDTGNPVLDTILTQKNHYCLNNHINFSCIVDGKTLNFMDIIDLSTLLGNAIDNAIEAVEKLTDPDQRIITLKIASHGQFAIIRLDNYFPQQLQIEQESFPQTSKTDKENHGYGLKSMEYIAKKYEGSLTFQQKGDWVQLKILLPHQE